MNEARYRELKEKLAALKSLYASRHYSQCAKFGELLLSEIHDQTHPLHLAHLHFYTALSHDTLAREATLKNRWKELGLAEVHYNAATTALSTIQPPTPCDPWSPTSSPSPLSSPYSRRRSSLSSTRSAASSATSLGDDDNNDYQEALSRDQKAHAAPTSPTPRPQTPQQFYLAANLASFARMLEAHAANVREQKTRTSVPTVRFTTPSPRASPTKATAARHSRSVSAGGGEDADEVAAVDAVRERRRNVRFRPRFDPSSVQRLCCEALAELEV